ncbi:MAG TPA: hypothetical protein VJ179_03910 [Patescibacteria group bacterium]|nr:hypothetical protein [Patescibacteria group bacterium]
MTHSKKTAFPHKEFLMYLCVFASFLALGYFFGQVIIISQETGVVQGTTPRVTQEVQP